MNKTLKIISLFILICYVTHFSFAQKKNETSAAVEFKNKYLSSLRKGDIETAKKALVSAKDFIDLAANHADTKASQKTNWLKGEIYANFITLGMQAQDTNFMKLAGENAINESISAFKYGYGLGKKMKSDFESSVKTKAYMLNDMANMLYNLKKFKEAAELFEYQAKYSDAINQIDSLAIYNASVCYEKSSDYKNAAIGYEKLTSIGYKPNTCAIAAASAYRKIKEYEKAINIINRARSNNPSNRDLLLALVNTNIETGDAAAAENALNDAINADPENKKLHYTIGTIYIELNENEKAKISLEKALEIDNNYADAQYQLGAHLVTWAGDLKTEANQLKFGDPNYNKLLIKSESIYKEALNPLESYIKNYPNDKAVLNILFQINRNIGNSSKALEYKKRADAL